jgi:hypothetical protein
MAEIDDQKLNVAKKMATSTQDQSGVLQPIKPAAAMSPTRIQAGAFRKDFSRASTDHMANVDLNQYGYKGGSDGAFDQNSYNDAYNNWLYNSNDVLANALTTSGQKLQYNLEKEAKNYRAGLDTQKYDAAELLKRTAAQSMESGLHNARKGANDRGLLYSNIREGDEQNVRGRVSGLLAQQIADSNSDFDKSALSREQTAAAAKINQVEQAAARQAELDAVRQQNAVSRAQQMQQLAGIGGYAAGRFLSSEAKAPTVGNQATNSYNATGGDSDMINRTA